MKRLILLFIIGLIFLSGCSTTDVNADTKQTQKQEVLEKEMRAKIGDPEITEFWEAQNYNKIMEKRDNPKLICYWYTKNEYTGKYIYEGQCSGFGVPYSTQISNPKKIVEGDKELGYDLSGYVNYPMSKPQAEPNGLYMPTSSSATWVLVYDSKTKESKVEYVEHLISVTEIKKRPELCEKDSLPDNYLELKP